MEMHSSQSLYAIHGISLPAKARRRPGLLRRLLAAMARMGSRIDSELRARAASVELMALSDRQLADIGIFRSEIDKVVRGQRPSACGEGGRRQP